MALKAGNSVTIRLQNMHAVFRYVYDVGHPVTKQDISRKLNLSLPTVTTCLNALIDKGYLKYSGTEPSTGGRKPRTISYVEDCKLSIGIDISLHHLRIVAINISGNTIAYEKIYKHFENTREFLANIASLLDNFIRANNINRDIILGVGISIAGIVSYNNGFIENVPTLKIRNMRISEMEYFFTYPIHLVNDATAGGFAEWWHNTSNEDAAYLYIENGVGGALMINGKAYIGNNGRSGEFGHICIIPNGEPCSCGQRGCLESYCSLARLSDDFNISIDDFFDELKKGNKKYLAVWDSYLNYLAIGIKNIRMSFDCSVKICGTLPNYLSDYMPTLQNKVADMCPFDFDGSFLSCGYYQSKSASIGAALYYVNNFLSDAFEVS